MKHLHTCLAEISSFVFSKQTKNLLQIFKIYQSQENSDKSWGIAAQLPRLTIKVEAFFQWWWAFKQRKTNQKTPTNQLISQSFAVYPCMYWMNNFFIQYMPVHEQNNVCHCHKFYANFDEVPLTGVAMWQSQTVSNWIKPWQNDTNCQKHWAAYKTVDQYFGLFFYWGERGQSITLLQWSCLLLLPF